MPPQPLPEDAAGRELRRTLAPGEQVLAYATGTDGALLVATDWRAIIIKAGAAASGTWFRKQNTSFRYGQISGIELLVGTAGDGSHRSGYVVINSMGEQSPILGGSRGAAHAVKAKNVCAFDLESEATFGQVVTFIRSQLYGPWR